MPNPLSADIRARFEVLFCQGLTGREIGRRLMISAAHARAQLVCIFLFSFLFLAPPSLLS